MSLVSQINANNIRSFSYDPATRFVGITEKLNDKYYFIIYDLQSGNEIKRIQISSFYLHFMNSTLYSSEGYYLKLNLKH